MRVSFPLCSLFLGLLHVGISLAFPQNDPPTNDEGELQSVDFSPYNTEESLRQVETLKFLRNFEVATFQYGIDNIPKFGFGKYPKSLVDNLKLWKEQAQSNIRTADLVLENFNRPRIPPCKYAFTPDILGSYINDTDFYLLVAEQAVSISLGQNLDFARAVPAVAFASGAAAANDGWRDSYIRTIAGGIPAPAPYGTVIPAAYAYWQSLYYTKPGSCPDYLPYGPFVPLKNVDAVPPSTAGRSPKSDYKPRTKFTFSYDSSKVARKPKYVVLLNQVTPPVFVPLGNSKPGIAKFTLPDGLVGTTFLALTSSNRAKRYDQLPRDTVAGPFGISVAQQ